MQHSSRPAIMNQAAQKITQDSSLLHAIICDLDGTLALFGNKNPFDRDFINDELNKAVYRIIYSYKGQFDNKVILFSGRLSKFREETERWLANNDVHYDFLEMRKEGDTRKDYIVKKEMFDTHVRDRYYIDFVLDDRNQVVDLWRSMGLTCLQVDYGDF